MPVGNSTLPISATARSTACGWKNAIWRGASTSPPPGTLGILRTLFEDGPRTVAEIARSRPVARQGVQRNADALAERGLVSYADNPRHRRSKLLVLTTRGEKACRRARDAQLAWAAWIDDGSESQLALQNAARVLRWCRQVLAAGPR